MTATIEWHSVADSLPEEGERVLVATPSSVLIGTMAGMTKDEPSRPMFIDRRGYWCVFGVKFWSKLPSLPEAIEKKHVEAKN